MHLFQRKKPRVFGAVDVGSDSIKALIFSVSPPRSAADIARTLHHGTDGTLSNGRHALNERQHRQRDTSMSAAIRPIEKFVWELPESYTGARLARKIRECVFRMVQRLEQVPEQIIIALGPTIAECVLHTWRAAPEKKSGMLTRQDINMQYHEIFKKETDLRRAAIVAPVWVRVNGYPLDGRADGRGENILPLARIEEIAFRVLSLSMTVENGAMFTEIKNTLGGMPISFVPLAVAYREAVVSGLAVRDSFVVDIGGSETTLVSLRDGGFSHAAFIPMGTRHGIQYLMKNNAYSFDEAQKAMRLHALALPGHTAGGDGQNARVAAAASAAADRWKASFVSALGSFAATGPISPDLFLAGGGARFSELRAALLAPDWLGAVSYAAVPRLRILEGSSFFGGDSFGGYLAGPEDAGLASLVIYSQVHRQLF